MSEKIYRVGELNEAARELLETGLGRVSVEGEISNLSRPASGHLYFSLKDSDASIACALFKGSRFALRMNWAEIANGVQVRVQGRVSLYAPRGQYQLIAAQMEPAGLGALEQEYRQRLARLQAEGLFAAELKQDVPGRALRIGVITSASGAALHDVLSTLKRRNPAAQVVVYPCLVQGREAPAQIIAALQAANRRQECEVLLLVRGGGSLEDLWAFNDEALARAVAESVLPVISGVGHEVDVTLADFAADRRAPTPTAAAEMVSPPLDEELRRLQLRQRQSLQRLQRLIGQEQQQLRQNRLRLQRQDPRRRIEMRQQRVDELAVRLQQAVFARLKQARSHQVFAARRLALLHPQRRIDQDRRSLAQFAQILAAHQPLRRLQGEQTQAAQRQKRLQEALARYLQGRCQGLEYQTARLARLHPAARLLQERQRLHRGDAALRRSQAALLQHKRELSTAAVQRLSLLNPLAVLARGYAVVENGEGRVVGAVRDLQVDELIRLRLADGQADCRVQALHRNEA